MWCPEGYVSLAEIAESVAVAADNRLWLKGTVPSDEQEQEPSINIDTGPPYDECEAYGDWLMARFLEQFGSQIRVASPTGAVLRIAPGILTIEVDDPFDYNDYRSFPDTREGRLRAGSVRPHWIKFDGMRINDDLSSGWELALKPIANFPLCISEAAIPNNVETLIDKIIEGTLRASAELEDFREGDQYKAIVGRMVEAWDNRELSTKASAKLRFGRGRKTEEWLALWRELVLARPYASKPGPRPKGAIR